VQPQRCLPACEAASSLELAVSDSREPQFKETKAEAIPAKVEGSKVLDMATMDPFLLLQLTME
jgi:hypothetical protein